MVGGIGQILLAHQRAGCAVNLAAGGAAQGVHGRDGGFAQRIDVGHHPSGGVKEIGDALLESIGRISKLGQ